MSHTELNSSPPTVPAPPRPGTVPVAHSDQILSAIQNFRQVPSPPSNSTQIPNDGAVVETPQSSYASSTTNSSNQFSDTPTISQNRSFIFLHFTHLTPHTRDTLLNRLEPSSKPQKPVNERYTSESIRTMFAWILHFEAERLTFDPFVHYGSTPRPEPPEQESPTTELENPSFVATYIDVLNNVGNDYVFWVNAWETGAAQYKSSYLTSFSDCQVLLCMFLWTLQQIIQLNRNTHMFIKQGMLKTLGQVLHSITHPLVVQITTSILNLTFASHEDSILLAARLPTFQILMTIVRTKTLSFSRALITPADPKLDSGYISQPYAISVVSGERMSSDLVTIRNALMCLVNATSKPTIISTINRLRIVPTLLATIAVFRQCWGIRVNSMETRLTDMSQYLRDGIDCYSSHLDTLIEKSISQTIDQTSANQLEMYKKTINQFTQYDIRVEILLAHLQTDRITVWVEQVLDTAFALLSNLLTCDEARADFQMCQGAPAFIIDIIDEAVNLYKETIDRLSQPRPESHDSDSETSSSLYSDVNIAELGALRRIIRSGSGVLANAAASPHIKPVMAETGLVTVLRILNSFGERVPDEAERADFEEILSNASNALFRLSVHADTSRRMLHMNGIALLLNVYRNSLHSADVIQHLTATLVNLSTDEECQRAIGTPEAIKLILTTIRKSMEKSTFLLQSLCAVLVNLSVQDTVKVMIGKEGGVKLLIDILETHASTNMEVTETVCSALANLATIRDNADRIVKQNGIPYIIAALRTHILHPAACEKACRALHKLISNKAAKDKMAANGAANAFVNTFQHHLQKNERIVEHCIVCLRVLSQSSDFNNLLRRAKKVYPKNTLFA